MEQSLTIHSEPQERGYILSLSGRLDTLGARELDETIGKFPEQPNLHLLLDMKNVTFLSSAGIRILIKSYKQCHNNGGECILAHVPAQAAGVLKMVGLEQLITGTEQQPTITQQEREQANILFQWQSLHQETGNFIRYEAENNKAPTFGPYDLIIGRDQNQQEFIVLNNQWISQSRDLIKPQYYIGTHGSPSHYITFKSQNGHPIMLTTLITNLLQLCEVKSAGIVITTYRGGWIGLENNSTQLLFTRKPNYRNHSVIMTGIIHTDRYPEVESYTRLTTPDGQLAAHLHLAVYPYLSLKTEETDLNQQLHPLLTTNSLQHLLHLVNDNRIPEGSGESRLTQGCAWLIKIE